ncbi:MAG TPA: carboxymuconolactone decarboxylase family protein, partial [Candidatus Methanomethylophilaceae archaeon]|nr:carboxymuconolactone decarboxylase family protein [Candidatus Methanomethylophilaceae archaeon]
MSDIEEKDFQDEDIEKALKAIERRYGFIPFINQVLSTRPDFFIPQIELSKAVFTNPGALSEREK